jgi:hypothetical protein
VNESLRPTALLLIALAAALAVAGCGGDKDDPAAKRLVRDAFGRSIGSAETDIEVSAELNGVPQLAQGIRVKLAGPYQSNGKGKLPSINWDVSIGGGGQTFSIGLLSVADQAFVNFQGTNYRLNRRTVAAVSGPGGSQGGGGPRESLRQRFGVDPLDWIRDAKQEDDAEVAGVPTRHVSADVDVKRALRDLNTVVTRTTAGRPGKPPVSLSQKELDSIADVVHDPRFDLYVGKADGKIRRLSLDLRFEVPEKSRARLGGLSGGTISIDVQLAAVGRPQRIEAPRRSRPIQELTRQLGGIGGLRALFGARPGGGGQSGSPPSAQQFKAYSDCLDKAKPSDRAAIDRCAALLR